MKLSETTFEEVKHLYPSLTHYSLAKKLSPDTDVSRFAELDSTATQGAKTTTQCKPK